MKTKKTEIKLVLSITFAVIFVAFSPYVCLCTGCFGGAFWCYDSNVNYDSELLISAIEKGDIETARVLLEIGVDPNQTNVDPHWIWNLAEHSPKRPLSVACETGNLEMVQLLIDYGATAADQGKTSWSPLREALWYYQPDDIEIVRLLLENGADPCWEESGSLPMFWAASMQPKVYDESKANGTVFSSGYDQETAENITEIVKMLMVEDRKNERGYGIKTLLIISVVNENVPLTEYLLSIDCDTTIEDSFGKTAYDYAVESGNEEIIRLLEEAEQQTASVSSTTS